MTFITELWTFLPSLLEGSAWTIALWFSSAGFAVLFGLIACLCRMSSTPALSKAAKLYIDVIRGTPLLLQLFYIYYALPEIGIVIPAFIAGVIGLSLHFGAYLAELFRAGIQSVDRGQFDAARSLALSPVQRLRLIILPQALRIIFPAFGNYAIVLLKESSLVSVIAVFELMRAGELLAGSTFQATKIYTLVAIIYLILCAIIARGFRMSEDKLKIPGYWGSESTSSTVGKM